MTTIGVFESTILLLLISNQNCSCVTDPIFFIIGAQKAGTTSMRMNLRAHPEIFMDERENHFFDKAGNSSIFQQQAKENLARKPSAKVIGFCSPVHMFTADALYRIHDVFPGAKLVASLRNPKDRAYSVLHGKSSSNQSDVSQGD